MKISSILKLIIDVFRKKTSCTGIKKLERCRAMENVK